MGTQATFKALGDPTRQQILQLLRNGKMTAGEIGSNFGVSGATISHHLSVLKAAELVYESRYKNFIYYELNASIFEELLLWIYQFYGGEQIEDK